LTSTVAAIYENVFWGILDLGCRNGTRDNAPPANSTSTAEITNEHDLLPSSGAAPGTMPTDIEQATGLERLEILGKMQGVDIFDLSPLDASRKGMYTGMGRKRLRQTCEKSKHAFVGTILSFS
jgi:hypothetical protein